MNSERKARTSRLSRIEETVELRGEPRSDARTPRGRMTELSVLLFLEHSILGAWSPLYQLHLRDLGFDGIQIGTVYSTMAIASIFAPWIVGHLADRVMPAQWVMCICHLCGAALLWTVGSCTSYWSILLLMTLNAFAHMPTLALSNTIVFRNLADAQHEFGLVRLFGTSSWIVMALVVGYWISRPAWLPIAAHATAVDSVYFAAVLSAILAVFCLMLPSTPPRREPGVVRIAAHGALRILRDRSALVLMLVTFILSLGFPFAYPLGGLFFRSLGVSDAAISPWMSLGQVGEVFAFFFLSVIVRRLGFKTTFLLGVACWGLRFGIWALGGPWPLVVFAIILNGGCYAFVLGLGQIFVDRQSDPSTRASAQSMHQVVAFGFGMWLGNYLAGAMLDHFHRALPDGTMATDFTQVYLWPALSAALCFIVVLLFFKTPKPREDRSATRTDRLPV